MNPVVSLPILITLTLITLTLVMVASWRASSGASTKVRLALITLRSLALLLLATILLNPGKWLQSSLSRKPSWIILQDTSASMKQPAGNSKKRSEVATDLANQALNLAKQQDIPATLIPFSNELLPPIDQPLTAADGPSSAITTSLQQALQNASSTGTPIAGVLLLSDGRQTTDTSANDFTPLKLLLQSTNTHLFPIAIGTQEPITDLELVQPRASFTSFAKQSIRIPFSIKSTGIPTAQPTINLIDASGKIIATKKTKITNPSTAPLFFEVPAPATSTHWKIEVPCLPGEMRTANNSSLIHIKILNSKTRIFLVEGAPYWDSKFLAQLLRNQSHVDLQSIHRLSDQRYFRINTGDQSEIDSPVFPNTIEDLCRYDMVILGKNTDPFLTPEHTALLRSYVRDFGGSILFSRGKATSLDSPDLEPLEPVTWGPSSTQDFRFTPTADGESTGLFGQCLPAANASLWANLPLLSDAKQVLSVKPFTRVLAEGTPSNTDHRKIPTFLVRRYGQGVTGLFNGDGLWKWDFYPEARHLGNCYEDFWNQTIQWMASYSEFLPGQDYSLRFPSYQSTLNTPQVATISYRGSSKSPRPSVIVTNPAGATSTLTPAQTTDPSGHPIWRIAFTPDSHGIWSFKLTDPSCPSANFPEASLTVPQPPLESDDLTPNLPFLNDLAKCSNDEAIPSELAPEFLKSHILPPPPSEQKSNPHWQPSWQSPLLAALIALTFAAEWFIRRRNGLA